MVMKTNLLKKAMVHEARRRDARQDGLDADEEMELGMRPTAKMKGAWENCAHNGQASQ